MPATLGANADGSRSTAYPCVLANQSDCKPPAGGLLAWDNTCLGVALAPIASQLTSVTTSIAIDTASGCLSGSNAASATLSFVLASDGTTACAAQWSVTGVSPNRALTDGTPVAGSGTCKLRALFSGSPVLSNSFTWNYIAAPGSDTTPPNRVTGIACTPGTNQVTCTFDPTDDPNDGVNRKGVAAYRVKINGSTADTLTAASPGPINDFTATAVGTGVTGSATQSSGANGGKWTVATTAMAFGLENGANDAIEEALANISGTAVCARTLIGSLPGSGTYNKAFLDFRNSTAATSAHLAAVLMRQEQAGTQYYLQYIIRPSDGGTQSASGSIQITGLAYLRLCVTSGVGSIDYSYDGGTWSNAFNGIAISLNDAKKAGCGASSTNDGSTGVNISVDFTFCSLTTVAQLSKTVSTMTGGTCTATATDLEGTPNESTATGGVTCTPNVAVSSGAKKWHPGYYLTTHRNNACLDSQSCRFNDYDNNGSNTHLQGFHWLAKWSAFESTQGNYTAGIALIRAELAHVKAESPSKRLVIQIMDEPNQSQCSAFACQAQFFPSYVASACTVTSSFNGYTTTHFTWWRPACSGYLANLLTAIGAAVDTDTALEAVILDYEQALEQDVVHGTDFSLGAFNAGVATVAAAAKTAFPKTNLVWRANWGVDYTNDALATLISTMKTNGIGWGDQDACDLDPVTGDYTYNGQLPSYISADNMIAGYRVVNGVWTAGQATDQRGKMLMFFGIETSSMGDNAVCGSPGLTGLTLNTTYGSYFDWVDKAMHATHAIIDYNDYTGIAEQKWAHASSNKSFLDLVNTTPLTHTACPTDYDTMFGNGSAGTGCDTSN